MISWLLGSSWSCRIAAFYRERPHRHPHCITVKQQQHNRFKIFGLVGFLKNALMPS